MRARSEKKHVQTQSLRNKRAPLGFAIYICNPDYNVPNRPPGTLNCTLVLHKKLQHTRRDVSRICSKLFLTRAENCFLSFFHNLTAADDGFRPGAAMRTQLCSPRTPFFQHSKV